jgi:hypothetical protein
MTFATFAAQELTALAERLSAAAAKDVDAATAASEKIASTLEASLDALRAEQAALAAENATLAATHQEIVTSLAQADAALRNHERVARSHELATREREAALLQMTRERDVAVEERTRDREAAREARARERDRMALEATRDQSLALQDAVLEHEQAMHEAVRQHDQALQDALAARESESASRDDLARDLQEARHLLSAARANDRGALVDRLQTVFAEVARSTSVDEVLTATANALAYEFTRVAVLTIRDNRLDPSHHSGFDGRSGIAKAVIPLSVDSFLTQAAGADHAQMIAPEAVTDAGGLPFGGAPWSILTAPIVVRGETLAVIYADDSGGEPATPNDDRLKVADLLRHHAMVRLDRLTIELKSIAELRAYAKMLLDEIEYVYAGDTSAKKNTAERQERLHENLRCARQIYRQRVALEGPAAAVLLEQHITAVVEAKAATPFGRELALAKESGTEK